jgi:hypothetical protein
MFIMTKLMSMLSEMEKRGLSVGANVVFVASCLFGADDESWVI